MGDTSNIQKSVYQVLGIFDQGNEKLLKIKFDQDQEPKFIDIKFLFNTDDSDIEGVDQFGNVAAKLNELLKTITYVAKAKYNNIKSYENYSRLLSSNHVHNGGGPVHNSRHKIKLTNESVSLAGSTQDFIKATGGADYPYADHDILVPTYMAKIIQEIQEKQNNIEADYHLSENTVDVLGVDYHILEFYDFEGHF